MPTIPDRFRDRYVALTGGSALVVADDTGMPTEEVARHFGLLAAQKGRLGIVVKLDYYSGSDKGDVTERFRELGAQ